MDDEGFEDEKSDCDSVERGFNDVLVESWENWVWDFVRRDWPRDWRLALGLTLYVCLAFCSASVHTMTGDHLLRTC